MSIALVVFDLAGTTVDDNQDVHRVLRDTLRYYGFEISLEQANEVMGIPKPVAIRMLLNANQVDSRQVNDLRIDEMHNRFVKNMRAFYLDDGGVVEKEGVSETFAALKRRGVKIFVDTGFDRVITDALLSRMQWQERNLIDGSVTSDEVPLGRPHPDLIHRAMQLSEVRDAGKVAKVGDTTADLREGMNAGCRYVIGVTSGAHSLEQLKDEYHTHLVEQIREVEPIVTGD